MTSLIKKILRIFGEAFLLCLMLTTVALNAIVLLDAVNAWSSALWPSTQAVIKSTDGMIQRARYKLYIDITYQYSVNGRAYTGEQVCFLEWFGCPTPILEKAEAYRKGSVVEIYYSPIWPATAVLFRDSYPHIGWFATLCLLPLTWLGSLFTFLPGWWLLRSKFKH